MAAKELSPPIDLAGRAIDPSDAYWQGIEMSRMLLDLELPSPQEIRSALRDIAFEFAPAAWVEPQTSSWLPVTESTVDTWLDQVIVEFDHRVTDPNEVRKLQAASLGNLTFQLMVGPNWLCLHQDHSVGDGWTANIFFSHLLKCARGEVPASPPPWVELSRFRRTSWAAIKLANRPTALPKAWSQRAELSGGPYQPASSHDYLKKASMIYRSSAVGFSATLRALRDEKFAGASVAGMTLAGLRRSISKHVGQPRPGTELLFNTRSGIASAARGNYSAGLFLHTDDTDPVALTKTMGEARHARIPDVAVLAGRLRHNRRSDPQVAAPTGAPRLTMSFMPRHSPITDIPGFNDRTVCCLVTVPNGVETITLTVLELNDRICFTISFYEQAWSRAAIADALDDYLENPEAVLTDPVLAGGS